MSWMSMLTQTYDNCPHLWGIIEEGDSVGSIPLLSVGQSTQNAQIEVILNANAELLTAFVITDKASQVTVIPCTEASIGRTGTKLAPHPLHDKLQYVAGDYLAYGGQKASGFDDYITQIDAWCESDFVHKKVKVIHDYLKKGELMKDLITKNILLEENGKLVSAPSAEQKERYPLYRVITSEPTDAFVRFRVSLPGELEDRPWLDPSVNASFVAWQKSLGDNLGLCYVQGERATLSTSHPAKMRHTGDKAKLISANDNSGFTFRGRFHEDGQAVGISYETSQKAHNMLKWLISRQGFRNDSQVFIAFGTRLQTLPKPSDDTDEMCSVLPDYAQDENQEEPLVSGIRQEYAKRLRSAMAGYGKNIKDDDSIVVIGLDSATPGRLSVIFYRELHGSDFLRRIENWHDNCSWYHTYKFVDKKRIRFVGAPSPKDIALAAYGNRASETLMKATVETLLHCIIDGKPVPKGIRQGLVRRASNPVSMDNWEWQKTLSIACALVRKNLNELEGGEWTLALNENNKDRSYLFGRLLAYAQDIESYVQYKTENTHRQTNAERMMHQFTLRPIKTWNILNLRLKSYLRQLKNLRMTSCWNTQTAAIIDAIGEEGYNDNPLQEQYLLGYSSQLIEFNNRRMQRQNTEEEENEPEKQD